MSFNNGCLLTFSTGTWYISDKIIPEIARYRTIAKVHYNIWDLTKYQ